MNVKLQHIKTQIDTLAKSINVPENLLPTYGNARDAHSNIELSDTGTLSYEIHERGQEVKMQYALDIDHLLYLVFRDVTYLIAINYSSKHPDNTIDYRRTQFHYQLELLGRLNPKWQQREKENQEAIVMSVPFDDYQGQRQSYLRELIGSGFLYSEAIEKVNQKYP